MSSTSYGADGATVTATDQAGRTTTTTVDAFGRVVSKVGAGGVTQLSSYDDGAAHTSTSAVVPDGAGTAPSSMVTRYDDRGRAIGTDTRYAAGSAVAKTLALPAEQIAATTYNGIGQPTTTTDNDLELTNDHSGPGGLAVTSTTTPQATGDFPGGAITASTVRSLNGDTISGPCPPSRRRSAVRPPRPSTGSGHVIHRLPDGDYPTWNRYGCRIAWVTRLATTVFPLV